MTKILYLEDPYVKEFNAKVVEVFGDAIVLDCTAFYPEGGGQPTDKGTLTDQQGNRLSVLSVAKRDGKILHKIDHPLLKPGDEVRAVLDWERRYKLMRAHTAAHLVSGVFSKETGALITGNQLGLEEIRIDFDLETLDREKIAEYFRRCNELIAQDLMIKDYYMPRADAEKDPSLFKLAKLLPPSLKELHIIDIVGFDRQADAGTHVKSLREIGRIEFLRVENKGKSNRRVYFRVG